MGRAAAVGGGAATAVALAAVGVLFAQAQRARRTIPLAEAPPPRCDGVYGGKLPGRPLTVVVLGDSTGAGYGVLRARETPGALLATGIARRLNRPVRLRRLAVVGAHSYQLAPQVEAAIECQPDLAVILIGANDVTHRTGVSTAVRHLVDGVRALRATGAQVVVGTCPDLGTIRPIERPLRWLARRWSRQLAAAQTVAVVEAGGWTVSLGDLLGPRFAAEPLRMFSWDHFHPSAEGYAAAAAAILPTAVAALGAEERPGVVARPGAERDVRSLPAAAVEAARNAGTEVSGARVSGGDRGPAGRWAQLRVRVREAIRPSDPGTNDAGRRARSPAGGEPAPPGGDQAAESVPWTLHGPDEATAVAEESTVERS